LVLGSFDQLAVDERGSGADERDRVRGVDYPYTAANAFTATRAWSLSSAFQISASAFFAPGCADFGSAPARLRFSRLPVSVSQADQLPCARQRAP
jgi:hypothetical protein